ncbi:MAG: type II toxin-antitoxin system death-on-curing family toxin [Chlamydiia bacterium]|nr:type II toxin-antitoxin system death-on-curing family toxin [Chlamydiia bacterium]
MNTLFFSVESALNVHDDLIRTYGGTKGVRDEKLLLSALAQVQASFGGQDLHPTVYDKGAAYLFFVVQNHPFVDGNKRTGTVLAALFLSLNGIELSCDEKALDPFVFRVASGKETKETIAHWLKQNTRSI